MNLFGQQCAKAGKSIPDLTQVGVAVGIKGPLTGLSATRSDGWFPPELKRLCSLSTHPELTVGNQCLP